MLNGDASYLRQCLRCQKQKILPTKVKRELCTLLDSSYVMKQIGVDLSSLPEAYGFCHRIVCIDRT